MGKSYKRYPMDCYSPRQCGKSTIAQACILMANELVAECSNLDEIPLSVQAKLKELNK